jgi:Gas vesicle synthesis protein GvpO
LSAREAAQLARECVTAITQRESAQVTALARADDCGWIVEVEVVEVPRIPPSTDVLGLYEIELDVEGELRGCRRTRRYMRGQALDEEKAVNADLTVNEDTSPPSPPLTGPTDTAQEQ